MEPDSSCQYSQVRTAGPSEPSPYHTRGPYQLYPAAGVCIRTKSVGSRFLLCRSVAGNLSCLTTGPRDKSAVCVSKFENLLTLLQNWGHAVAQFVEALRYKPVGRGFDYRLCHWNSSLT
jgi:hypothetical protein